MQYSLLIRLEFGELMVIENDVTYFGFSVPCSLMLDAVWALRSCSSTK